MLSKRGVILFATYVFTYVFVSISLNIFVRECETGRIYQNLPDIEAVGRFGFFISNNEGRQSNKKRDT